MKSRLKNNRKKGRESQNKRDLYSPEVDFKKVTLQKRHNNRDNLRNKTVSKELSSNRQ